MGAAEMAADMPRSKEDLIKSAKATYEVQQSLGKGAFGEVFKVLRLQDKKELAMKCESVHVKKQILRHEAKVLQATLHIKSRHIVEKDDQGQIAGRFVYIVIRLVGRNLWDLKMETPDKKFSLCTSLRVAEQTLAGIRDLHRAGFLHRDVKPPNFAIGREEEGTHHTVYILDFGLCRRFRTHHKEQRMPRERAAFRGTTRYASLSALEMKDQSRKDDLESWWYMMIEWTLSSGLPWRKIPGTERDQVKMCKITLRQDDNLDKLLEKTPLPFAKTIIQYLDALEFNMIPDYDYIYFQIAAAYRTNKLNYNDPLDWDPNSEYRGPKYEVGVDLVPKLPDHTKDNKPKSPKSKMKSEKEKKSSSKEKSSVKSEKKVSVRQ